MVSSIQIPNEPLLARNFVAGSWYDLKDSRVITAPYTGSPSVLVQCAPSELVSKAVVDAQSASLQWRQVPLKERTTVLLRFRELLLRELDQLANYAAWEAGKTFLEGRAEVLKGIEVLEYACSLQNSDSGGVLEVSRGVSCEYRREPLGVVAGITPFNFPAMVPMWMIPIAIAVGNSFILKPSDKVPYTPCRLAELFAEAGLPPGVFTILQGGREVVEDIIHHELVQAVAFVGSSPVAKDVYRKTTSLGKRALCLGGAKNHLIVVPDADPKITVEGVVSSFTGCAGQRCMAASVLLAVGEVEHILSQVKDTAAKLMLGRDMGALIDTHALHRLRTAIERAEQQGARVVLDGRTKKAPLGFEKGTWLAPTILDHAKPGMECISNELFGPVLSIIRVSTLDEALELDRMSAYGNATSVFTTSGAVARVVSERCQSGMIGINIGVPVPREPFSFGGTKESKFGCGDITGSGGVEFWSNRKKITTKWAAQTDKNWMS
jgi:malonate-semialdehyde dehydrogenase (acetylating)/methylmalonate-semialdehyde dehydrogenase